MAKFIIFNKLADLQRITINMDTVKTMEPVSKLYDGHMKDCTDIYYENHRVTVLSSLDDIMDVISGMEDGGIEDVSIQIGTQDNSENIYNNDLEFTENITDQDIILHVGEGASEPNLPPTIWMKTVRTESNNTSSNVISNAITLPTEEEWLPAFPNHTDGPYFRTFTADKVLPQDQDFVYVVYKCYYKSQGGKRPYRNRRVHNAFPVKVFVEKSDAMSYIDTNNFGIDTDTIGFKHFGIKQPFDDHYKWLLGYAPTGNQLYTYLHSNTGASYGDEYF